MDELTPEQQEARNKLKAHFGKQISEIDQAVNAVRQSGSDDPNTICLHNACRNLLQLCAMIIGVAIFPEDVQQQEASNDEVPTIIQP